MKSTTNSLPLGELLRRSAAKLPNTPFLRLGDDVPQGVELRTAELDRRADSHMNLWLAAGLGEGARVGMIATPEPEIIAAIVGAARAGVEVVLMSPGLDAPQIAARAGLARAPALAGPAEFAGVDYAKRLSEARGAAGAVAWLMLWEADRPRFFRLDNAQPNGAQVSAEHTEAGLAIATENGVQALQSLVLRARAGDYVDALGIGADDKIVSLVSPATPAGLVVSAHAPLITGARLVWQAPFSAALLQQTLSENGPTHLVAPAGVAAELARAGLLASDNLSSLTLVVPEKSRPPIFDADIDAERVFFLEARLQGPRPLTRLATDTDAGGEELS